MFKNPLKYQQGGKTQDAIGQLVKWLVQNTGLDENQISQRLNQILSDDTAKQELVNNLQNMQKGDQNAAQNIIGMFTPQSAKFGGKIQDFICKHKRGGKAGCGCKQEGGEINQYGPGGWIRGLFRRDPQGIRQVNVTGFDPDGSSSDPFYGSEMIETLPNARQRRIRSNWWRMGEEPVRDTSIVTPAGKVSNTDENWRSENEAFDRAKYIELPGTTIDDYVEQQERLRNPGEMERGGKVLKGQRGLSSGRFDIPFGAYMKAYFNKRRTPNVGAATNRSFGYSTSNGNEYYLEDANVGRNSVDTWVNVTPKKDTIIMQKLPSDHVNDLEDYQMEAIMQRMRPDIKRVNSQKNGGNLKKKKMLM